MVTVVKEVRACVDCYLVASLGNEALDCIEESRIPEVLAGIDALAMHGYVATDSIELGFSWQPCECCNSRLGGDRFIVVAIG